MPALVVVQQPEEGAVHRASRGLAAVAEVVESAAVGNKLRDIHVRAGKCRAAEGADDALALFFDLDRFKAGVFLDFGGRIQVGLTEILPARRIGWRRLLGSNWCFFGQSRSDVLGAVDFATLKWKYRVSAVIDLGGEGAATSASAEWASGGVGPCAATGATNL